MKMPKTIHVLLALSVFTSAVVTPEYAQAQQRTSVFLPPSGIVADRISQAVRHDPGAEKDRFLDDKLLSLSAEPYAPFVMKGLAVDPQRPFEFEFFMDAGQSGLTPEIRAFESLSHTLIRYFLAALTIPEEDLWVNLSPNPDESTMATGVEQTGVGQDLLAQDFLLKQLSASLLHPDSETGALFWKRVYAEAFERYGTTDIPVDTFHKIWIVPDQARLYQHQNKIFTVENHLKVMLEQDYLAASPERLAISKTSSIDKQPIAHSLSTKVMREVLIPAIEKEVNTGKHFAPLRQIYSAMILATWYKRNLKKTLLAQVYADQKKDDGQTSAIKHQKVDQIYQQYLASIKEGVFDFIREEQNESGRLKTPHDVERTARHYFAGGANSYAGVTLHTDTAMHAGREVGDISASVRVKLTTPSFENHALYTIDDYKDFPNITAMIQKASINQRSKLIDQFKWALDDKFIQDLKKSKLYKQWHKLDRDIVEQYLLNPVYYTQIDVATQQIFADTYTLARHLSVLSRDILPQLYQMYLDGRKKITTIEDMAFIFDAIGPYSNLDFKSILEWSAAYQGKKTPITTLTKALIEKSFEIGGPSLLARLLYLMREYADMPDSDFITIYKNYRYKKVLRKFLEKYGITVIEIDDFHQSSIIQHPESMGLMRLKNMLSHIKYRSRSALNGLNDYLNKKPNASNVAVLIKDFIGGDYNYNTNDGRVLISVLRAYGYFTHEQWALINKPFNRSEREVVRNAVKRIRDSLSAKDQERITNEKRYIVKEVDLGMVSQEDAGQQWANDGSADVVPGAQKKQAFHDQFPIWLNKQQQPDAQQTMIDDFYDKEAVQQAATWFRQYLGLKTVSKTTVRLDDGLPAVSLVDLGLQPTGSFKPWIAYGIIRRVLTQPGLKNIVAATTGNQGIAVAYVVAQLNKHFPSRELEAHIYVNKKTSPAVKSAITALGGKLIELDDNQEPFLNYDISYAKAQDDADKMGAQAYFVKHADRDALVGYMALGDVIVDDIMRGGVSRPNIIVPVGAGGLSAGIALAAKHRDTNIKVYLTQTERTRHLYESFKNEEGREAVYIDEEESILETGIDTKKLEPTARPILYTLADGVVIVDSGRITSVHERFKEVYAPLQYASVLPYLAYERLLDDGVIDNQDDVYLISTGRQDRVGEVQEDAAMNSFDQFPERIIKDVLSNLHMYLIYTPKYFWQETPDNPISQGRLFIRKIINRVNKQSRENRQLFEKTVIESLPAVIFDEDDLSRLYIVYEEIAQYHPEWIYRIGVGVAQHVFRFWLNQDHSKILLDNDSLAHTLVDIRLMLNLLGMAERGWRKKGRGVNLFNFVKNQLQSNDSESAEFKIAFDFVTGLLLIHPSFLDNFFDNEALAKLFYDYYHEQKLIQFNQVSSFNEWMDAKAPIKRGVLRQLIGGINHSLHQHGLPLLPIPRRVETYGARSVTSALTYQSIQASLGYIFLKNSRHTKQIFDFKKQTPTLVRHYDLHSGDLVQLSLEENNVTKEFVMLVTEVVGNDFYAMGLDGATEVLFSEKKLSLKFQGSGFNEHYSEEEIKIYKISTTMAPVSKAQAVSLLSSGMAFDDLADYLGQNVRITFRSDNSFYWSVYGELEDYFRDSQGALVVQLKNYPAFYFAPENAGSFEREMYMGYNPVFQDVAISAENTQKPLLVNHLLSELTIVKSSNNQINTDSDEALIAEFDAPQALMNRFYEEPRFQERIDILEKIMQAVPGINETIERERRNLYFIHPGQILIINTDETQQKIMINFATNEIDVYDRSGRHLAPRRYHFSWPEGQEKLTYKEALALKLFPEDLGNTIRLDDLLQDSGLKLTQFTPESLGVENEIDVFYDQERNKIRLFYRSVTYHEIDMPKTGSFNSTSIMTSRYGVTNDPRNYFVLSERNQKHPLFYLHFHPHVEDESEEEVVSPSKEDFTEAFDSKTLAMIVDARNSANRKIYYASEAQGSNIAAWDVVIQRYDLLSQLLDYWSVEDIQGHYIRALRIMKYVVALDAENNLEMALAIQGRFNDLYNFYQHEPGTRTLYEFSTEDYNTLLHTFPRTIDFDWLEPYQHTMTKEEYTALINTASAMAEVIYYKETSSDDAAIIALEEVLNDSAMVSNKADGENGVYEDNKTKTLIEADVVEPTADQIRWVVGWPNSSLKQTLESMDNPLENQVLYGAEWDRSAKGLYLPSQAGEVVVVDDQTERDRLKERAQQDLHQAINQINNIHRVDDVRVVSKDEWLTTLNTLEQLAHLNEDRRFLVNPSINLLMQHAVDVGWNDVARRTAEVLLMKSESKINDTTSGAEAAVYSMTGELTPQQRGLWFDAVAGNDLAEMRQDPIFLHYTDNFSQLSPREWQQYLKIIERTDPTIWETSDMPEEMMFGIEMDFNMGFRDDTSTTAQKITQVDRMYDGDLLDLMNKKLEKAGEIKFWDLGWDGDEVNFTDDVLEISTKEDRGFKNKLKGWGWRRFLKGYTIIIQEIHHHLKEIQGYLNNKSRNQENVETPNLYLFLGLHVHLSIEEEADMKKHMASFAKVYTALERVMRKLALDHSVLDFQFNINHEPEQVEKNITPAYFDEDTNTIAINTISPPRFKDINDPETMRRLMRGRVLLAMRMLYSASRDNWDPRQVGGAVRSRDILDQQAFRKQQRHLQRLFHGARHDLWQVLWMMKKEGVFSDPVVEEGLFPQARRSEGFLVDGLNSRLGFRGEDAAYYRSEDVPTQHKTGYAVNKILQNQPLNEDDKRFMRRELKRGDVLKEEKDHYTRSFPKEHFVDQIDDQKDKPFEEFQVLGSSGLVFVPYGNRRFLLIDERMRIVKQGRLPKGERFYDVIMSPEGSRFVIQASFEEVYEIPDNVQVKRTFLKHYLFDQQAEYIADLGAIETGVYAANVELSTEGNFIHVLFHSATDRHLLYDRNGMEMADLQRLSKKRSQVEKVIFSKKGRFCAVILKNDSIEGREIVVFNQKGKIVLRHIINFLNRLEFSPDESRLVIMAAYKKSYRYRRSLIVFDLNNGDKQLVHDLEKDFPVMAWSSQHYLMLYYEKTMGNREDGKSGLYLLDDQGRLRYHMSNDVRQRESIEWSEDPFISKDGRKLILYDWRNQISKIIDIETGRERTNKVLGQSQAELREMLMPERNQLYVWLDDGKVRRVWHPQKGEGELRYYDQRLSLLFSPSLDWLYKKSDAVMRNDIYRWESSDIKRLPDYAYILESGAFGGAQDDMLIRSKDSNDVLFLKGPKSGEIERFNFNRFFKINDTVFIVNPEKDNIVEFIFSSPGEIFEKALEELEEGSESEDAVMVSKPSQVGGIDLNGHDLALFVENASKTVKNGCDLAGNELNKADLIADVGCFEWNFEAGQLELFQAQIEGFKPVIIDIKPVLNAPQLLGLNEDDDAGADQYVSFIVPKEVWWGKFFNQFV